MGISVLMSVYKKENPEYLDRALRSIYTQTLLPEEIVLVEDGELTPELYKVIDEYYHEDNGEDSTIPAMPPELRIIKLPTNKQLGKALEAGLKECRYDLIARMDSDDIARLDRIKIQSRFMEEHLDISACGGDITEFIKVGEVLRTKTMPTESEDLYRYGKFRNPLNHMTVMFRKQDIEKVGGYTHFPFLEDYHLWSRLLAAGYKIANIPKVLCEARISEDFADKRGGQEYFKLYKKLRSLQLKLGYTNYVEYAAGLLASAIMTRQPVGMRETMYTKLRSKTVENID